MKRWKWGLLSAALIACLLVVGCDKDNTLSADGEATVAETATKTETETAAEITAEATETETEKEPGTESESETEPPHVHKFGDWVTVTEPTCTETGEQTRSCACGETERKTVEARGHDEVSHEAKEPTCTEAGWDAYVTCSRCDYTTYVKKTDLGHSFVDDKCERCGLETSKGLKYALNDDGSSYSVTGIGTCTDTDIVIPAVYERKPVTDIGMRAFSYCESLTSITIPGSVTEIGSNAFSGCTGLTSVTIGNGVTDIGMWAFSYCESLTSIIIPDSVTVIDYFAFRDCTGLTSVTIGNGVTSIGDSAFYECKSLTSIIIPDSVTSLGKSVFCGCKSLTSIIIPDSVTSLGKSAFVGCSALTSITIPFVGATKNETSNDHFGYIFGASSYYENSSYVPSSLKTVVVTGGTSIGDCAFLHCSSLTSIIIPDGVTSIGHYAFSETAYYEDESNWMDGILYIGSALIECKEDKSGAVIIKDGTTCIADYAFAGKYITGEEYSGCKQIQSITIPDSVIGIGEAAFCGCSGLTSITIPDSVTSIGYGTFGNCSGLKSITIPNSVTSIGDHAFSRSGLASITIPDGVTSIGNYAFCNCSGLTNVIIGNGVTRIGDEVFFGCSSLASITIPFVGSIKDGKKNQHFGYLFGASKTFDNSEYVPSSLRTVVITGGTGIGDYAFYGCESLQSITIPDSVISIGYYAFASCESLTSVTIPDSVTSIGDHAFYNCSSLTSITIPDSVTSIGYGAFDSTAFCSDESNWTDGMLYINHALIEYRGNKTGAVTIKDGTTCIADNVFKYTGLKSIVIPDSVIGIGEEAFRSCYYLKSITIPDSVTSIGEDAFAGTAYYNDDSNWTEGVLYMGSALIDCKENKTGAVIIRDGTICIADYAFAGTYSKNSYSGCKHIQSITIPDSVTSIGEGAFYYCESLTHITIPNGVTSIGDYAFFQCSSLTSITIPDSVTSIGKSAFYGCKSLTSITIPDSVTSIGEDAFSYCYCLRSITIPDGVTSISDAAFHSCERLTSITIPDGVTYIGDSAFEYCGSLTSIIIPAGVTEIGNYAFEYCESLTSIIIPASVTEIGNSAFRYCKKLDITFTGTQAQWAAIKFGKNWNEYSYCGVSCTDG